MRPGFIVPTHLSNLPHAGVPTPVPSYAWMYPDAWDEWVHEMEETGKWILLDDLGFGMTDLRFVR